MVGTFFPFFFFDDCIRLTCLPMSHEQSVRFPAEHDCVTAWATPADVTARINADSLVPAIKCSTISVRFLITQGWKVQLVQFLVVLFLIFTKMATTSLNLLPFVEKLKTMPPKIRELCPDSRILRPDRNKWLNLYHFYIPVWHKHAKLFNSKSGENFSRHNNCIVIHEINVVPSTP